MKDRGGTETGRTADERRGRRGGSCEGGERREVGVPLESQGTHKVRGRVGSRKRTL